MHNDLYFDAEEIAAITGGEWENLKNRELFIKEFHNTYHYLKSGDCFIVRSNNWPNPKAYRNNEHKLKGALKKGVSCIIAREDLPIKTDIPILRVKNSYFAIKKLAKYAAKATKAKKVLITGSYGKTGFKLNLAHISKEQKSCYVRADSANYAASTYCKLASIKRDNELFFLEIPVATKEKVQRRSRLIKPDIGVITSIGHENIERFKSIDNIIENKLSIAHGIKKGGKLLLPHDDKYYAKIKKEALKYGHVDILTYGTARRCNANLLYKKFRDLGWDVIAKIEDKVVAYRVPFFEEYAVSASLGVLLCTYHLGLDVHKAADEYYGCENFKSSGIFYKAQYKDKEFYLYDQSNRGGLEGYESFFRTISYIEPKNGGQKILVTSEFVDYEDGEMGFIDAKRFQKLIRDSGIASLYSVEKFSEHIDVLEDRSIWKRHSIDFNNIKDEVIDSVQQNDILCIKGIFESHLPKFVEYIKALEGMSVTRVRHTNDMQMQNLSFNALKSLSIKDMDIFKRYVREADKSSWIYYFPFLYLWSLSNSREVLIGLQEGSMDIFLLRALNRTKKPAFEMFVPSLPFKHETFKNSLERVYRYYGRKKASVLWVDRDDLKKIRGYRDLENIIFNFKEQEYMYDPKIYEQPQGHRFRNIRKAINKIKSLENVEVIPYSKEHKKECLELLETWQNRQDSKYENFADTTYTKMCLEHAHLFDKNDLFGLIIKIDSKIRSFNFAGEITKSTGNLFIAKSDHNINGLNVYMQYLMMSTKREFDILNAASDMGYEGLRFNKRSLLPAKMLNMYKARYNPKVYPLNEKYIDEIADIQEHVFKEEYIHDLIKKEALLRYIVKKDIYGYLSRSGNLKGFIILKRENKNLRIYALAAKRSRRGIGSALIGYVIDEAKRKGFDTLSLEVDTNNVHAVGLYKKFGFSVKELLRSYYENGADAYRMNLELP